MVILIIAVVCLVFGLLLYLPFALWFRRRRRRGESMGAEIRYTRSGYLFAFAMLATFLVGLCVRTLAPDSWFAGWIQGDLGLIRWGIGIIFAFQVAEMVLLRADVTLLKSEMPATKAAEGEPTAVAGRRRLWRIATIRGVPIFVRGSLPTTGLLIACFADAGVIGTISYSTAFIALILVHELGHLAAARAQGLRVFAIVISGVGGSCLTQLPRGVRDTFVLFAGGLIAQAVLLATTLATVAVLGDPQSPGWHAVVVTFTIVNLLVAATNLVPGKIRQDLSNDGAVLWDLLLHIAGRKPHPLAARRFASVPSRDAPVHDRRHDPVGPRGWRGNSQ
jgi:Zn-dependent protease